MKKKILIVNSSNYIRNFSINNYLKKKYFVKEINFFGNFFIKNLKLLKIIFCKFDLILINWNTWSSFFTIFFINLFKNKPIIYDAFTLIHEDYLDNTNKKNIFKNKLYKIIEKLIYLKSDIILTDTEIHKKSILKVLKFKKKIYSINVSQKKLTLKNTKNKSKDKSKIYIVHAGANRKAHNVLKIINLIYKLPHNLKKKINLTLITPDYNSIYKKLVFKLKLEKNISLINFVNYRKYLNIIYHSDICMGLFGKTKKAQSTISNFIVTATNLGKVIVTKETLASKKYLIDNPGVILLKEPQEYYFLQFINKYISSLKYRKSLKNKSKKVYLNNFQINKNYSKLDSIINNI